LKASGWESGSFLAAGSFEQTRRWRRVVQANKPRGVSIPNIQAPKSCPLHIISHREVVSMWFPALKKTIQGAFLGAVGFNLETGLARASSSITPLPRRCYNYSGVNSLSVRRKPSYLQPVCIHQLLAKNFLREAEKNLKKAIITQEDASAA